MWRECKDIQEKIVMMRRDLHQIPELGKELPKTAAYVAAELDKLGIPYTCSKTDSGIIAVLEGSAPGKTIALRADMDALPVTEATDVTYASKHTGWMHACGHDAHTAMLLAAARVLKNHQSELKGTVRFLFQTAEEINIGASIMIENGGMDDVDAVFGIHIGSIIDKNIPSGKMMVPSGCCMAAVNHFTIRVKGTGCHGSTPEKGIDPINIAAHIVLALQTITVREINACKALVLTIGKIQAGSQYNIIPDEVLIEGTIRTLEEETRQYAIKRIEEISTATASMFGGSAEYEIDLGTPPVINHEDMAAFAAASAKRVLGEDMVITRFSAPNMGGEDFAYYLQKVPGAFMFLSSSDHEKGTDQPHHSSKFNIDESVLWEGAAVLCAITEDFLK